MIEKNFYGAAEMIKFARESAGYTKTGLTAAMGYHSVKRVTDYEDGEHDPRTETLMEILDMCDFKLVLVPK